MLLLGIETSCDDTATAVVRDGRIVLSNVVTNQDAFHAKYGGIVPEIASRRHLELIGPAVEEALERAGVSLDDIDGVAVTSGPGLVGSLTIGVATAKALAFAARKRLFAVNHLHGHLFAPFLERAEEPPYPFLALLVSGGHTQLVRVASPMDIAVLGKTRDDAAGEAFDKTARLLGLGFPGGPAIQALAAGGNPAAVAFPRYRGAPGSLDFSFSGLKTSVRYFLERPKAQKVPAPDIAASFQAAVVAMLVEKTRRALEGGSFRGAVLSGGVAANEPLRTAFERLCAAAGVPAFIPPLRYATDNAAMIAAAAERQHAAIEADPLTLTADPGLPFELGYAHFPPGAPVDSVESTS